MPSRCDCKDCGPGSKRPAPYPGPRCATHHREFVKAQKARAASGARQRRYDVTDAEYEGLRRVQGGRCAICRRATGRTRRLSVDHDHAKEAVAGVRASVRGLLCRPCNDMLGHCRDNPAMLIRAAVYLLAPPALALPDREELHHDR